MRTQACLRFHTTTAVTRAFSRDRTFVNASSKIAFQSRTRGSVREFRRNIKAVIICAEDASAELPSVFHCIRMSETRRVAGKLCVSLTRESRGGNSFGGRISTFYIQRSFPFPLVIGKADVRAFRTARNFAKVSSV